MAQLESPGVSVQVIDESFYSTAAPGTVPLIVFASAQDKAKASSSGIADGTKKANAGKVYSITSQRELVETFGTPIFKTDINNNPIHAGELNEYGLQAAYSYLGSSTRAYVVRADLDLSQLNATGSAPTGYPADGTFWLDTSATKFGIFEWNGASANAGGQVFVNKIPSVITDTAQLMTENDPADGPRDSYGAVGDYAIVAIDNLNTLWFKKSLTNTAAGVWKQVGTADWAMSWPAARGLISNPTLNASDDIEITVEGILTPVVVSGASNVDTLATNINSASITGIKARAINGKLEIYSSGATFSINNVDTGTTVESLGLVEGQDYLAPVLTIDPHTSVPSYKIDGRPTGSLWIKTTTPNLGAEWIVKQFNSATKSWNIVSAPLYKTNAAALAGLDKTGGGVNLGLGRLYVKCNDTEAEPTIADFKIYARNATGSTVATSQASGGTGSFEFRIKESKPGSSLLTNWLTVNFTGSATESQFADNFISALTSILAETTWGEGVDEVPYTSSIVASKTSTNRVTIKHLKGGEILIDDIDGVISTMFDGATNFYADASGAADQYVISNWISDIDGPVAEASSTALTTEPENGQLWYNSITDQVDILINTGTAWVGYKHSSSPYFSSDDAEKTDPNGPIISSTEPTQQSDGSPRVTGDIWIDNSDLENYPLIYKFNSDLGENGKWVLVDTSDQTTEEGIVFADARWATSGAESNPSTIVDLLVSNYVDPDAPDPTLYPRGTLLWNLRRSGFNVKKFVTNYINKTQINELMNESMTNYYANRWVSEAANLQNGAGAFGRLAQRAVVVQALQALVTNNQQIREEENTIFNLMACPGYPELIDDLVLLNYDRGLTSLVIGDTPARLPADATSLSNWGANLNTTFSNNVSGLSSYDEYLAVFYPWGYTSDNLGNNVVVPPSHMMLRTIALSDSVSYPWFAPAGTRRGGIVNAGSVGYVNAEGEFVAVNLNTGQRDALDNVKINPITYISGSGLVNYGQLTRARNASSLDRINVARLVVYLRRRFSQLAKPYVFEPNDKITRDELKGAAENLLLELVGQRALYDYIVVCDETNNTPARIDRNELYLDIAIEPVKAVEFIYIPLRLKNTGEIKSIAGR